MLIDCLSFFSRRPFIPPFIRRVPDPFISNFIPGYQIISNQTSYERYHDHSYQTSYDGYQITLFQTFRAHEVKPIISCAQDIHQVAWMMENRSLHEDGVPFHYNEIYDHLENVIISGSVLIQESFRKLSSNLCLPDSKWVRENPIISFTHEINCTARQAMIALTTSSKKLRGTRSTPLITFKSRPQLVFASIRAQTYKRALSLHF